mmetsp:Transcript_8012/g.18295  ORF Transcript_8012/g.18295 Transcript_8012/m.18295 type:complete len:386 (+) Transcript_8012:153-1310(+)
MLNNTETMQRSRRRRTERDRTATATIPLLLLLLLSLSGTTNVADAADDDIEYWTDYAIYPKACVNYNDMDQILYAMHEKSSNHCTDNPVGTFVTPVPTFVDAYIDQLADNAADAGEEYEYPDLMNYLECTYKNIAGGDYYIQLGCSDGDTSSLAVNIYTDAQCTESSDDLYGGDDANVEIDFALKYQCTPCVTWGDKNDDQIDDQYYQNKQTNAPLCGAMWDYRQECSGKCLMLAKATSSDKEGWNKADKILLSILGLFGFGMFLAIMKKRQSMSKKNELLEQAAISAAGLSPTHILGMFALLLLVITMFALLNLKKITWTLLLFIIVALFSYLMKLTIDGSVKETIIGPDGKIVESEDSDDEDDVDGSATSRGDYANPELPAMT